MAVGEMVAQLERELRELEADRDQWKAAAVRERELAASDAFKRICDRVTDELDRKAGASQALAVAVALATAAEAGRDELRTVALKAAHHLRNLPATRESDDRRIAEELESAARNQP